MSKVFSLKVFDNNIDNDVLSSDMEETVEEFLDMYITIVYDLFVDCGLDEKAVQITNKMRDREYETITEYDEEEDTEYTDVIIHI